MTYGILNKKNKLYFAGFKGNETKWTSDLSKAWRDSKLCASAQASLFHAMGVKVQQKPIEVK